MLIALALVATAALVKAWEDTSGFAATASAPTTVQLSIAIPARPATASHAINSATFTPNGGSTTVLPLTSTSPGCSAGRSGRVCTIGIPLASGTKAGFTISTFASTDGSGTPLRTTQSTQTIVANQANAVNATLNAVVSSLTVTLSPARFTIGTAASSAVTVDALDPSGSMILVGPNALVDGKGNPVTVTLTDSERSATKLSRTTLSAAPITLAYDGGTPSASNAVITATASSSAKPSIASASASAAIASTSLYSTTVAGDKPLVYYRLNESSGTTFADSSGNEHPAFAVGTIAFGQGGLIKADASANSVGFASGYAMETVTYSEDAVTAEAWIRPTAADLGSTNSPRLIGNAWTDNSGKGYMLWIDGGRAKFYAGYSEMIDPVPLVAGRVYHLVGTYDDNGTPYTTHMYVNGVLVGQNWSQTPQVEAGDTAATNIGVLDARSPGPGYVEHFQGAMGDVAIYTYALSAQQAVTHYNVGAQTSLPVPTPIPPTPAPTAPPTPMPIGTPIAYNATSACIYHTVYTNNVLPAGEGEFGANGLDRTWWGRYRGDGTSSNQLGNWVSGVATSTWGRKQYDTYFGDADDGLPGGHDPFFYGPDTGVPGRPNALRITANAMFPDLVGNSKVDGKPFYAGMLMTPVKLTYGFIVARVRTPQPGPGLSPAFWVLQGQGVQAGPHGNLSDEWDIQEMFGDDIGNGMNQGELIWNSAVAGGHVQNWGGSYNALPNGALPSAGYHDYGVLISPGGATISTNYNGSGGPGLTYGDPSTGGTFFVDGQPVYGHTGGADINLTATSPGYKEIMAMFQVSSSGWLGGASSADLPASYWLQWIRVYQPTNAHC